MPEEYNSDPYAIAAYHHDFKLVMDISIHTLNYKPPILSRRAPTNNPWHVSITMTFE